ncbi:MAG: protein-S-isoprenylcysteine O-methyltransferase [Pseudomonadota bacterium]
MMAVVLAALAAVIFRWRVNGWASLVWVATAVVMSLIRAPYAKRTQSNVIAEKRAVVVERILLALVAIGGTFLPLVHLATGLLSDYDYRLPDWAAIGGAIVLAPSFWLFWRSHADLGRNWSVTTELREGQELVTRGVYRRIRHPMYTAIWLIFLMQPLFVQNLIAGPAGVVAFALMYVIRVPYEEKMMRAQFGDAYDAYCDRTGRLWPK